MSDSSPPKTGTARAAAIKRMQEEALHNLPINTLYIGLWIRSDPPAPGDFHWAYYLHTTSQSGRKYHIANTRDIWSVGHGSESGITKSLFLCCLIKIGRVPEHEHGRLDSVMRSYDADLEAIPGVTCRVWLLHVLQRLIRDGLVRCSHSVDAVEAECKTIGNEYRAEAAINKQPRPIVCSALCHCE
jgi:hypothetical protein